MTWTHKLSFVLLIALCVFFQTQAFSQYKITGKILADDSLSVVAGATIRAVGSKQITYSDTSGLFNLNVDTLPVDLQISSFDYLTETVSYDENTTFLQINLEKEDRLLDEVVINFRARYRNRDNPAVELIRRVIEHKKNNSIQQFLPISFHSYEKINLALLDPTKWVPSNPL